MSDHDEMDWLEPAGLSIDQIDLLQSIENHLSRISGEAIFLIAYRNKRPAAGPGPLNVTVERDLARLAEHQFEIAAGRRAGEERDPVPQVEQQS